MNTAKKNEVLMACSELKAEPESASEPYFCIAAVARREFKKNGSREGTNFEAHITYDRKGHSEDLEPF